MKRFEKFGDVTIKTITFPIRAIVGLFNAIDKNMPDTLTMPYEIKKKNRYIPLASANRHIPAHLRDREKSTFWNIVEAPEMMVKEAIRGTVEGGLQLAPMLLPSVIPSNVKNQIVEDIKEGYRDVDDYLAENSFGVWDYLKKTFDPETNTAEEMGGLLLSLGFGTAEKEWIQDHLVGLET